MSSSAGPSQFAQLLKRSKFATYDPTIAQIYTTYGGYAHRGDYGLKRPFPASARGKNPYVVIKAIDSPVMQTEWSSAQAQGRWIKRYDETGASATAAPNSKWGDRGKVLTDWEMSSSFEKGKKPRRNSDTAVMLPNFGAMTETEFQAHLDRIRALRPDFKRYLLKELEMEAQASGSPNPSDSSCLNLVELSKEPDLMHREYLGAKARKATGNPRNTSITPVPHPSAGLSYSQQSSIQRTLLHPPVPARIIQTSNEGDVRRSFNKGTLANTVAAVGGTLASLQGMVGDTGTNRSLRFSEVARDRQPITHGEINARVEKVTVLSPPNVVGAHNGLGGAQINMAASEAAEPNSQIRRSKTFNPHRPGTQEYAGFVPESVLKPPTAAFNALAFSKSKKGKDVSKDAVRRAQDHLGDLAATLKKGLARQRASPEESDF